MVKIFLDYRQNDYLLNSHNVTLVKFNV